MLPFQGRYRITPKTHGGKKHPPRFSLGWTSGSSRTGQPEGLVGQNARCFEN